MVTKTSMLCWAMVYTSEHWIC